MIAKKQAKAKQGRQASAPTAYPLHPVTREYDDFTVTEANVVRESLRALGLRNPIVLWKGQIVDGRHRDMFCRELGIKARYDDLTNRCKTEEDMRAYVAALNEHRRSRTKPLTIEEKREKVDAALKADPERSDQTATARRVVRTSGGSGHFGIRRPSRIAPGLLRVTAPFC